jgi:hypothetical protein
MIGLNIRNKKTENRRLIVNCTAKYAKIFGFIAITAQMPMLQGLYEIKKTAVSCLFKY